MPAGDGTEEAKASTTAGQSSGEVRSSVSTSVARAASPVVAAGLCGRFLMKLSRHASAATRLGTAGSPPARIRDARA